MVEKDSFPVKPELETFESGIYHPSVSVDFILVHVILFSV